VFSSFIDRADNYKAPLLVTTYVYDIVNPDDIVYLGAKPIVKEYGPFVYTQRTQNYDLNFGDPDHLTLFYKSYASYTFVPEQSAGWANETMVTTVNMPFVSVRNLFEKDNLQAAINYLFTTTGSYVGSNETTRLFARVSAEQVLFGWYDPVLASPLINAAYGGLLKNYPSLEVAKKDPREKQMVNQIYTGAGDTFPQIRNYILWHNMTFLATCPASVFTQRSVPEPAFMHSV
jgi:hypothetical protein